MKYYLPDQGEGPEDAREVNEAGYEDDPEYYAKLAAEDDDARNGGDTEYPRTIGVVDDNGVARLYTVEREFNPSYSAAEVKAVGYVDHPDEPSEDALIDAVEDAKTDGLFGEVEE